MTANAVDWDAIADEMETSRPDLGEYIEPPDAEIPEPEYDQPDADIIQEKKRPRGAIAYDKKIKSVLSPLTVAALKNDATQADGAALLMYGPKLTESAANLAATNDQAARMVDWLTEGTENHALALIMVAAPLLLQVVRNHEPQFEPAPRGIKIPFSKGKRIKIPWKIGIRLGGLRSMTADPDALVKHALSDPRVVEALRKQGVFIATS